MAQPEKKFVKINIDGTDMTVPEGTKIIEASLKHQKYIPHFCYHEGLSVVAQCRMCFVEIEGAPKLATACSTPVAEGMKILTASEKVKAGQNGTLEFTLLNHPLDCPICDRGGECKLQDYTYEYGPPLSRMEDEKEFRDKHRPISDEIVLDQERCILCTRCVRFSSEIDGRNELLVKNRGHYNTIDVFEDRPLQSLFSGNVVDLCPVGALTAKDFRFAARPWELKKHEAICTGCSSGCNIEIHTKHRHPGIPRPDNSPPTPHIERLVPRENAKINAWWLCDKGRWGYHFNNDMTRLTHPQVRTDLSQALRDVHLKEVQEALAQNSHKQAWEFWLSDSVSFEEMAWAKELQVSWMKRDRKVVGINALPFAESFMKVWKDKAKAPWVHGEANWENITHVVSALDSYRDLENLAPMISLKLGPAIRNQRIKWQKRPANALHSSEDALESTVYLLSPPRNEEELKSLAALPENSKFLLLWSGTNARGLLNEGIVPLEALSESLKNHVPKGPVFFFHQTTQNPLNASLVNSLKQAPFLVMATSFADPLTEAAHVLLPLTPLYESQATLTSMENFTQVSKGIRIDHPNQPTIHRGGPAIHPALRLILMS